jgi:hypothetical protein
VSAEALSREIWNRRARHVGLRVISLNFVSYVNDLFLGIVDMLRRIHNFVSRIQMFMRRHQIASLHRETVDFA